MRDIAFAIGWIMFSLIALLFLSVAALFLYVTWPICWIGEAFIWCLGNHYEASELRTELDQHYAARKRLNDVCASLAYDVAHPFSNTDDD